MVEAPAAEPEVAEPETQPALVPPDPEEAPPAKVDAPEQCGARHEQHGWICAKPTGHDFREWHIDDDGHYWGYEE